MSDETRNRRAWTKGGFLGLVVIVGAGLVLWLIAYIVGLRNDDLQAQLDAAEKQRTELVDQLTIATQDLADTRVALRRTNAALVRSVSQQRETRQIILQTLRQLSREDREAIEQALADNAGNDTSSGDQDRRRRNSPRDDDPDPPRRRPPPDDPDPPDDPEDDGPLVPGELCLMALICID